MQISAQTPAARWAEIRRGGGLDVARAFVSSGYYQAVQWEKKPMTVTYIQCFQKKKLQLMLLYTFGISLEVSKTVKESLL